MTTFWQNVKSAVDQDSLESDIMAVCFYVEVASVHCKCSLKERIDYSIAILHRKQNDENLENVKRYIRQHFLTGWGKENMGNCFPAVFSFFDDDSDDDLNGGGGSCKSKNKNKKIKLC
jgi:hypothetical protein